MKLVTVDFETYYDKQFSLSKMTTEAYIRDKQFEIIGVSYWIDGDPAPVWLTFATHAEYRAALAFLSDCAVIAHHAAFDCAILEWVLDIHPRFIFDTLSMAAPTHMLTVGGSLSALSKFYQLGEKGTEVVKALGKHRWQFTPTELAEYGRYCINDVVLTRKLFTVLKHAFPRSELELIDLHIRMYTQPVLQLDKRLLMDHFAEVRQEKAALLKALVTHPQLVDTFGELLLVEDFEGELKTRLSSNPQFAACLRVLGVEPPMKVSPRTGKQTYAFAKNDVAFTELLEHEDLGVQALVAARLGVKSTIDETRALSFLRIARRGAMPVPLKYYAAHTGRSGGWDKINLQNLRRGGMLRKAIMAPAGHTLVIGDSAQIEARMNAWFSEETELVEDFAAGVDIYSKFASSVYGREVDRKREEIDPDTGASYYPDKLEGFVGKTGVLGLGYSTGHIKLQHTLKTAKPPVLFDEFRCREIVNLYRRTYRKIVRNWYTCEEMLNVIINTKQEQEVAFGPGGCVVADPFGFRLPNGMYLRYPQLRKGLDGWEYKTRKGWVKIYGGKIAENLIQALARIVVFDQMLVMNRWCKSMVKKHNQLFRVVLTVHDEIGICVPDEFAAIASDKLTEVMRVAPAWAKGLPLACEVQTAVRYGDAK